MECEGEYYLLQVCLCTLFSYFRYGTNIPLSSEGGDTRAFVWRGGGIGINGVEGTAVGWGGMCAAWVLEEAGNAVLSVGERVRGGGAPCVATMYCGCSGVL